MSPFCRLAPWLLVFSTMVAVAAEPVDEATARQLVDGFVEDITTFSAGFEQVLLDPDGEVLELRWVEVTGVEHASRVDLAPVLRDSVGGRGEALVFELLPGGALDIRLERRGGGTW